jgi:DNA-binding CsgD family transcriptional regulator
MDNPGLILLDAGFKPIYSNPEALQILVHPGDPGLVQTLDDVIREKLGALLTQQDFRADAGRRLEFRSGKRRYVCRVFPLDGRSRERSRAKTVVVLFERSPHVSLDFEAIARRYDLTPREKKTAQLLLYGLTSKEIAVHLDISPNTVKVFLRMIMQKMAVTTRTGIVGKILENQLEMVKLIS